jgi:hypothetical protein
VKPLKAKLTALGERHIRQNGGEMAEKWRRTEDFYDNPELKDEKGNQNWGQIGFLLNKFNGRLNVIEMGEFRDA